LKNKFDQLNDQLYNRITTLSILSIELYNDLGDR
jgi:hypothetical protein